MGKPTGVLGMSSWFGSCDLPINDFAFKKTFGTPENKRALMSLLNSILELNVPIADVKIENS